MIMTDIMKKDACNANYKRLDASLYRNPINLSLRPLYHMNMNLIKKNYERWYIMHYKAEYSINPDKMEVIDYIPTFLCLKENGYSEAELIRFLKIVESEVSNGSSFDMLFLEDCRFHLSNWVKPDYGNTPEEVELCQLWLDKLDSIEDQNIINTHKNRGRHIKRIRRPTAFLVTKR